MHHGHQCIYAFQYQYGVMSIICIMAINVSMHYASWPSMYLCISIPVPLRMRVPSDWTACRKGRNMLASTRRGRSFGLPLTSHAANMGLKIFTHITRRKHGVQNFHFINSKLWQNEVLLSQISIKNNYLIKVS